MIVVSDTTPLITLMKIGRLFMSKKFPMNARLIFSTSNRIRPW